MHERGDEGFGGHGSVGKKGERKALQIGQVGGEKAKRKGAIARGREESPASRAGGGTSWAALLAPPPAPAGPRPDRPQIGPDPAGSNLAASPDCPSGTHPTSPSLRPHPLARPLELRLPSPLLHRDPGPTHPPTHPPGRGEAKDAPAGPRSRLARRCRSRPRPAGGPTPAELTHQQRWRQRRSRPGYSRGGVATVMDGRGYCRRGRGFSGEPIGGPRGRDARTWTPGEPVCSGRGPAAPLL